MYKTTLKELFDSHLKVSGMLSARRHLMLGRPLLFSAALTMLATVPAWCDQDEGRDITIDIDHRATLQKNGASNVVIHVTQASDDLATQHVWLEGRTEKTIWQKPFPMSQPINIAKCGAEAKGSDIEIWFQYPFSAATTTQRFGWDGKELSFKGKRDADASADAVKKYIALAESGTRKQFEKAQKDDDLTIMYPGAYVTSDVIAQIIKAGHKTALADQRIGKVSAAADRMALAFDLATDCASVMAWGGDAKDSDPDWDQWLSCFESDGLKDLPASAYIPALNDYGYFLQEQNNQEDAIAIFKAVIKRDANRIPVYLNLSDSLWATGKKVEARKYYSAYQERVNAANDSKSIPPRVVARLK